MQQIPPALILSILLGYFLCLIGVSYFTSKGAKNSDFFLAGRKSPWYLVAFAMVGTSISGVTFISIPGRVGAAAGSNIAFSYLQLVLGYVLGYVVIALILLPLYYRLNLTSIYGYLEQRLGRMPQKTGSAFFMLSRLVGSSLRMFLMASVLYEFAFKAFGVPFEVTVLVMIMLIWLYTFKGGIKTVIWTDTLQTVFFLAAGFFTVLYIGQSLDLSLWGSFTKIAESEYSKTFFFEGGWSDPNNFFKQFFSGALITIVMTGLDQDMMQKNLTCRNLRDAQKNMFSFSIVIVFVNLLFLSLGAMLYFYATEASVTIPEKTDLLYPTLAFNNFPQIIAILFIVGFISAAYSSADSTLAALTTAFCIDFLDFEKKTATEDLEQSQKKTRMRVHIVFTFLMYLVIVGFNALNSDAIINAVFEIAGYTYGPLLGLFVFGIGTDRHVRQRFVVAICVAAPIISFILNKYSAELLGGFKFGFLILAMNGLLTFLGLWAISYKKQKPGA